MFHKQENSFEFTHLTYEKNKNYTKLLTFKKMYGNSNNRIIEMEDEEKNILIWTTTDYSKMYKNFRTKAYYSFKLTYILDGKIRISYLRFSNKNNFKEGVYK